jgi:para-nitrobenzyl esterase
VQASRLTARAPDAQALADRVSEAFIAFFRTGNTRSKLPAWPRFDAANRPTMIFDSSPALRNDPLQEQRLAIWNTLRLT